MEDALPQGRPMAGAHPGHEVSTIGVRTIGMFTAGLLAVCVVVCLILWLWMEQLKRRERRVDALYPGRLAVDVDQFPQPQLQQNPRTELARVKQEATDAVERTHRQYRRDLVPVSNTPAPWRPAR